jgi:DNA repair protein RecO (recombination protein O)
VIPKRYSSEAIVLARRSYSEADRIIVVFSKKFGKLSLLAKGVRKLESRKRGSLEVFSQMRFAAARGKNLDLIIETEIVNSFPAMRKNLKKVAVAYYLMEVVGRITKEEERNVKFYSHILKNVRKLAKATSLRQLRKDFVYDSLVLLGYWPKGKPMDNPDAILEEVIEREISSVRVGKKLLS